MKIRTDFVTNSSSSSFSVALTITDKSGKAYSVGFDPYEFSEDGGFFSFSGSLEHLSIKGMLSDIQRSLAAEYALKEASKEDRAERNARIENVKADDELKLVMTENGIELCGSEGSLGILPGDAARIVRKYVNEPNIVLKAVVSNVTPLSARSKSAKIALISVSISAEAKNDNLFVLNSVPDLCRMLVNMMNVNVSSYDWDDEADEEAYEEYDEEEVDEEEVDEEEYEDDDYFGADAACIDQRKQGFVDQVSRGISSVRDIASIEVKREYSAWGECADLVADNDAELCRLAKEVISYEGEVQAAAMEEMESYIRTSNPDRFCESFGEDYEDFRYIWNGDRDALLTLAKRLCSGYGPGDVEGEEVNRFDMTTGECERYAAFKLQ